MKLPKKSTQWMELLVFTLFALSILYVLLTGAQVYRRLVDEGDARYGERTAIQYLSTRVRQAESVQIDHFGDGQALALIETIDGEEYVTRVYRHDGYLMELFCLKGAFLRPSDGEQLLPVESMTLELENSCLRAAVNGHLLILHIPAGKEVFP